MSVLSRDGACVVTSCDVTVMTYDVMDYTVNTANTVYDPALSTIVGKQT